MQNTVTFVKKNFNMNKLKIRITAKLGTYVIVQVNTEVLHIAYVI